MKETAPWCIAHPAVDACIRPYNQVHILCHNKRFRIGQTRNSFSSRMLPFVNPQRIAYGQYLYIVILVQSSLPHARQTIGFMDGRTRQDHRTRNLPRYLCVYPLPMFIDEKNNRSIPSFRIPRAPLCYHKILVAFLSLFLCPFKVVSPHFGKRAFNGFA